MAEKETLDLAEGSMEDDDLEVAPELAASMGFSSFGNASKKRKYNSNDAFVDVANGRHIPGSAQAATHGNGANALPLGTRSGTSKAKVKPTEPIQRLPVHGSTPAASVKTSEDNDGSTQQSTDQQPPPELASYRYGVKQADGTMAYFLPSFIEDPWADLLRT